MLYANYIRNKMRHLVKIVFASGYPLKVISRFKKKAAGYTIHGKTEIGKNLIPFPYAFFGGNTTKTVNGITFTDNRDGTITLNGTSTLNKYFSLVLNSDVYGSIDKTKTYTISMQGGEIGKVTIMLALRLNNKFVTNVCTLSKPTIDFASYSTEFDGAYITLTVEANASFDNVVVKPQFELGDTATEYEPYTEYGVGDKTNNLISYPYVNTTKTANGITFTDNKDGSVTVNGTATDNVTFYIKTVDKNFKPSSPILCISGCPAGGSSTTYRMTVNAFKQTETGHTYVAGVSDIGNGVVLNLTNKDYSQLEIVINVLSGTTVNNLVFRPMLVLGDTATDYEPYGYKIPLMNSGKNLIPYPYARTTQTINGITITDNGDGSITVNGTATDKVWYPISTRSASTIYAAKGIYTISGCPSGGGGKTYHINCDVYNGTTQVVAFWDSGNGNTKDLNSYTFTSISVSIGIVKDITVNNLVFRPMLELGEIATDYEPYRAPDTTNVYNNAQLKDGESINYKADDLPELQLYKGENNITADTAVTPSAIDIKYLN